jgi:3-oxoacyl-[acyl-carrier protein] reductase
LIDPALEGKVVAVTGANNPHGIGAAVAKAFAAQGAKVFLHYFRSKNSAHKGSGDTSSPGEAFYYSQQVKSPEEVLKAIRDLGVQAHSWEADLSDATAIPELFNQAERALGPVAVLVNNAAHWEGDTFLPAGVDPVNKLNELWTDRPGTLSVASFNRIFDANTRAPALLMCEFARRHVEQGARWGRIVNVSTDGAACFPSEISYAASKFALESYTRSAAAELGQWGITVNAVSLGPVQTGWITPELETSILPTIPMGRIGSPEDVADVIVFLASEQARWMTGQKLYVGGGHGM